MEDIGLFKQGWKWFQSQNNAYSRAHNAVCFRDRVGVFIGRHWPMVCGGCAWLCRFLCFLLLQWRDCIIRGFRSFIQLGSAALLLIMWSCFLSLTSISCLAYVLLSMGAAGASVKYLGYTPGLFIVGLFVILILWMYANFWITGTLFMVGGCLFSFNHARPVVLMATIYAIYCVKVQTGWIGVFSSVNLAFFSNYALNYLLQWCDNNVSENLHAEEPKKSEMVTEEDFPGECEHSTPSSEYETPRSCKSSNQAVMTSVSNDQKEDSGSKVVKEQTASIDEMRRILNCMDHYEALGFSRHRNIHAVVMKKEYRKKAILVHPDKNMGSPLASESFKKLQCAYEVLSDSVKKRDYDEHLRKEEFKTRSVCHKYETSQKHNPDYCSEESRRIQCTKCGHSHIWVCTSRNKTKARWCQDCCQHHHAKDGDGWVEYKGSLVFERPQKMEIPRAFVCAEGKIFDVSEWAICQGMACRPNTHRPSFHVNVGLGRTSQRSMSSRYPWDSDAEMMDEDEEEFELWLQQALASGLFRETSKWRPSWSPFKLNKKLGKQWRRTSC